MRRDLERPRLPLHINQASLGAGASTMVHGTILHWFGRSLPPRTTGVLVQMRNLMKVVPFKID